MKFLCIIGLNFEILRIMRILWMILLVFAFSCQQENGHIIVSNDEQIEYVEQINSENQTVRNTIDWEGNYEGVVFCDNCKKPDFKITLYPDNTYEMTYMNVGSEVSEIEQGSFEWNIEENKIRLNNPDKDEFLIYKNQIKFLETNSILKKVK